MTLVPFRPETQPKPETSIRFLDTFRFRDFRLLWFGLLISNLGSWMQLTALGYLVVRDAPNAEIASVRLGFVGLAMAIPALIFSPVGGVVADTQPRRRTLMFTNAASAALALALALEVQSGTADLTTILIITALSSATRAFDSPARQSWVPLLVPREYVGSAIGLNSVAFNGPSVIGPSIAGLLIVSVGLAQAFFTNAFLTLAVVAALFAMQPVGVSMKQREPFLTAIGRGLGFLSHHPVLRYIVLGLIVNAMLLRPYLQLLPAFVVHELRAGPRGLGLLLGANGVGAVIGAIITAVVGSANGRAKRWALASCVLSAAMFALALTRTVGSALPWLILAGASTLVFAGTSNILIQSLSPDSVRGRAVSAFTMIILGLVPLGTMVLGVIAGFLGLRLTLLDGALASFLAVAAIWITQPQIREA